MVKSVFLQNQPQINSNREKIKDWADHPTTKKIAVLAGALFLTAFVITLPLTLPLLGTAAVCGIGGTAALVALTFFLIFKSKPVTEKEAQVQFGGARAREFHKEEAPAEVAKADSQTIESINRRLSEEKADLQKESALPPEKDVRFGGARAREFHKEQAPEEVGEAASHTLESFNKKLLQKS